VSDIHVRLTYSPGNATVIHVAGEGPQQGLNWGLGPHQCLFLNTKGGDGGDGGHGQNGQQGGKGMNGRDATRSWDATVSEMLLLSKSIPES
jgi:hypothetical protein